MTLHSPVWLMFRNELLLIKRSRLRLVLILFVPAIGALLPALMVLSASSLTYLGVTGKDALAAMVVGYVKMMAPVLQLDVPELLRWAALRMSSSYFVLTPWVIVRVSGAFAIAAERERRTIEYLLATPIRCATFLHGKLLSLVLPAILVTWASALFGWLLAAAAVYLQHGLVWLPDLAWCLSVGLLPPLMALHCAVLSVWISLSARDPQSAAQLTSLVVIPVFMLALTLLSSQWLAQPQRVLMLAAGLLLCAPLAVLLLARRFTRQRLLGHASA